MAVPYSTMNLVSIVTPVGGYHTDLLPRCITSVEAQTIPCTHIVVHDMEGKGAGWARNTGLRQVDTPFVVFLDCDDWIEKDFIEACLRAYDEKRYIYTDWLQDGVVVDAPDCAWINRTWHPITTLLPMAWVNYVGGFDEQLSGGEDTRLYVTLTRKGMCGKRLASPLFHYGKEGRRGKAFVQSAHYHQLMQQLQDEFGGQAMSCCGENTGFPQQPANQQLPGQVLAKAVWGGNRQERGRVTGTLYPRAGNGSTLWVYPEDAHAAPFMFQVIPPTLPTSAPPAPKKPVLPILAPEPVVEPVLNGAAEVAAYVNENSAVIGSIPQALPAESTAGEVRADVQTVVRKAQKRARRS